MTTNPVTATRIGLSCNHVLVVDGPAEKGDKVDCPKCGDRPRTIKRVEGTATTIGLDDPVPEAVEPIPAPTTTEPQPEGYDLVMAAQDEHRAMQAWIKGGREGDRPSTTNLDRLNAAHAGGNREQRGVVRPGRKPRNTDPIRLAANQAKKAKGKGGRPNLRKLDDAELLAYVRQARAEHPDTRSVDLRDYAQWEQELSMSYARWDKAWAAVDAEQAATTTD